MPVLAAAPTVSLETAGREVAQVFGQHGQDLLPGVALHHAQGLGTRILPAGIVPLDLIGPAGPVLLVVVLHRSNLTQVTVAHVPHLHGNRDVGLVVGGRVGDVHPKTVIVDGKDCCT